MSDILVYGSSYLGSGRRGDFSFMIQQALDQNLFDSLYIFNDNVEDHSSAVVGGGVAAIRVYNIYSGLLPPLSAGIPTGSHGVGFASLDSNLAKDHIDSAIEEIKNLIEMSGYKSLYFSSAPDGLIGSKIFTIGQDVRQYITDQIRALSNYPIIYDTEIEITNNKVTSFDHLPESKRIIAENLKNSLGNSNDLILESLQHYDTPDECANWILLNYKDEGDSSSGTSTAIFPNVSNDNPEPNYYSNIASMVSNEHIPKVLSTETSNARIQHQAPSSSSNTVKGGKSYKFNVLYIS
jgi:hypothetical protein